MKYKIALCEDEPVFADIQERACRAILDRLNIDYSISSFSGSGDFLKSFENEKYDLILLDIIMDGLNGMDLARRIRSQDRDVAIIFVTSSKEHVFEGYDVRALHYLEKPLDEAKLERLILADYNERFYRDYFVFEFLDGKRKVDVKDIICMETSGRRVDITLTDGNVYYSGKLTELLNKLPKGNIVRCHQAFAVNLTNIRELTSKEAICRNGKMVPISRTFAKDVKKAFIKQLWVV